MKSILQYYLEKGKKKAMKKDRPKEVFSLSLRNDPTVARKEDSKRDLHGAIIKIHVDGLGHFQRLVDVVINDLLTF